MPDVTHQAVTSQEERSDQLNAVWKNLRDQISCLTFVSFEDSSPNFCAKEYFYVVSFYHSCNREKKKLKIHNSKVTQG